MKAIHLIAIVAINAVCSALLSAGQANAQHLINWGFEQCFNDQEFYHMAGACDWGDRPAPGWQIASTSTDAQRPCVSDAVAGTFMVSRFGDNGTSYSLRMIDTWDDLPLQVVSDPIPCRGHEIFVGSGSVYIDPGLPGETKSAELGLRFYRGPDLNDDSEIYDLVGTTETGRWVELTSEATVPLWATHVRLVLSSGAAAEQVAYFEPKGLTRFLPNGRFSIGNAGQLPRYWTSLEPGSAELSPDGRLLVSNQQPRSLLGLGWYHSCSVAQGILECWGSNLMYQLGPGFPRHGRPWPGIVENLPGPVVRFTTGYEHSCAIIDSGELWCWGSDKYGRLGDGWPREDSWDPVLVGGIDHKVIAATAGRDHTCAVDETGAAWCWGSNLWGQLGNDWVVIDNPEPMRVHGLDSGVVDIKAGSNHTCALLEEGRLLCWGIDEYGQVGDGSDNYSKGVPTQVHLLEQGVSRFAVGFEHTCAVMESGAAKCWGRDNHGQLGDNYLLADKDVPATVWVLTDVVDISAGAHHTCALIADSTVKCWGSNHQGQLGFIANQRNYPIRTIANSLEEAVTVQCGGYHTCGARKDGELLCWGQDSHGQVGNHYPKANEPFPVYVKQMGIISGVESRSTLVVPHKTYRAVTRGVISSGSAQSGAFMSVVFRNTANEILPIQDPVQVTALSPSDPEATVSLDVQAPPDAVLAAVRLYYPYDHGIAGWQTAFDNVRFGEVQPDQTVYTDFFTCGTDLNDACGESFDGYRLGSDGCAGYLDCDTQCVDPFICFTGECHHELE